ncbi:protein dispatched homolog 2 isoform X2 [Ambystoma mexicanum]|uniref:protein dispatched homolog 2 isoform X2 n=1 Tax=Ambystoma mexicanum TaxID=8296 RepID=UPI0037E7C3DE
MQPAMNRLSVHSKRASEAEGMETEDETRANTQPESSQSCDSQPRTPRLEPYSGEGSQERFCRVHQCPINASPIFSRDHLPSCSSHSHGLTSNRTNGQVPSNTVDLNPNLRCCHCSHQDSKDRYTMPHLPGHEERGNLCSRQSSLNHSPTTSVNQTSESQWKQWTHDQQKPRPKQHHIVTVSYSQVIADWPVAVLGICSLLVLVCTLAGLLVGHLPDFSEPLMRGFEPRDTDIGRKQVVWKSVQSHTGFKKTLSLYPYAEKNSYDDMGLSSRTEQPTNSKRDARPRRMVEQDYEKDGFFCGPPGKSYAQLVFMSKTGSLWNLQAIQSMCRIEQEKIRSHSNFEDLCERTEANKCCPSWSLGNYIAVLYNRSSCFEITQADISHTLTVLRSCAPDYHNGTLVPSCVGPRVETEKHLQCAKVPEKCTRFSAIYHLLHFLVDKDFLSPQTTSYQVPSLKYSVLFLPAKKGPPLMGIYLDNLESWDLYDNYTSITGMDLGLKQTLFQHYMLLDTVYPVLAILAIFLSMSIYLRSVFITFMVMLAIVSSLIISFFLYKVAFRLTYFPFVNLIAIVLLSSICANHTFVFYDLWNVVKVQNPTVGLQQWVCQTMHQFGYLMLVSCFTTGSAFYSSYMSKITAVRCFAIYMGTCMVVSLAFMVTWLPASMVIYERYIVRNCIYKAEEFWNSNGQKKYILTLNQKLRALQTTISETSKLLFEKLLPCGVIKFRYIWICWFAALAIGGAYISCLSPKLKLPTSEMASVQVFRLSHPFERYDAEYCHQFMFERQEHGEGQRMPIMLVWGVMPIDNGDHFNPKSNGTLVPDATFSIQSSEAQRWLLEFCHKVKNHSFYYFNPERKPTVCFMEEFQKWMGSRQCSKGDHNLNLCCNHFPFPYRSDVLLHCIKMMVMEQGGDWSNAHDLGLRFNIDGKLVALVLQFQTKYHYSFNYNQTRQFYNNISHWLSNEIKAAPSGLQNGWFTSNLDLYNLQLSLSTEMMVVTGLSVAIAFVVLLLTTWNVLLSVFSIVAIGGTVLVTIGLLVLLEWQLNAVESLFVSAAVGLSVDFTVNYSVSYHLCPHSDRLSRVAFSIKQMSCATAMGASALFSAGIIMLPATVLAYRKLGIFIMMIKCISCGFASFFFQSLCCFFGPEKNFGQILWPCSNVVQDYPDDPRPNGTFACGGNEKQIRLRKDQESNTETEQYELQPLSRKRSDSFGNSTCTSKLSNRPSVLSEDMPFQENKCSRLATHHTLQVEAPKMGENHRGDFGQCSAMQTSSPYKQTGFGTETEVLGNKLCRGCRCQKYNPRVWNGSVFEQRHSASIEGEVLPDTSADAGGSVQHLTSPRSGKNQPPGASAYEYSRCLCSSGSSFDVLNDSNETCLSDFEQSTKLIESISSSDVDVAGSSYITEKGHLNGKRDTLKLALRETVFDISPPSSQQNVTTWKNHVTHGNEAPIILPNSKPDMPDVWIRRSSDQNSGYSS